VKNLSLILNVVLAIAVGFLYYLHFAGKPISETPQTETEEVAEAPIESLNNFLSAGGIYFINTDSLWDNYELVKKAQDELQMERKKLEGQFQVKLTALEKDYMDLQEKASRGLMTMEEAQKKEADLMQRQQKLMELKDELTMTLVEKEQNMNDKIQKAIYDYLKKYKESRDINFVLGYAKGAGAVLYGNDSLEITADIVRGLNQEYNKKNSKAEAKK
jgi:outer membrane protein